MIYLTQTAAPGIFSQLEPNCKSEGPFTSGRSTVLYR